MFSVLPICRSQGTVCCYELTFRPPGAVLYVIFLILPEEARVLASLSRMAVQVFPI